MLIGLHNNNNNSAGHQSEMDILVLTLDLNGRLTYANLAFCQLSGFSSSELNGADFASLYHPDMPHAVTAGLWQSLKHREVWMAPLICQTKTQPLVWFNCTIVPLKDTNGTVIQYLATFTELPQAVRSRAEKAYQRLNSKTAKASTVITDAVTLQNWMLSALVVLSSISLFQSPGIITLLMVAMTLAITFISFQWRKRYKGQFQHQEAKDHRTLLNYLYSGHKDSLASIERLRLMQHNLSLAALSRVGDIGMSIGIAADHSHQAAEDVNHHASQQKLGTASIAAAMQQMETTIGELLNLVNQTNQRSQDAASQASQGQSIVSQTQLCIADLSEHLTSAQQQLANLIASIDEIEHVSNEISEIADQTNLLALNAAIEAARAGEQGRGFSVVADEVRNLSQRTQQSTQRIHQMLEQLNHNSSQVAAIMQSSLSLSADSVQSAAMTFAALQSISQQTSVLAQLNEQTAAAVEQQAKVTAEVSHNATSISASAANNEQSSEKVVEHIARLHRRLSDQQKLLSQFL